MDAPVFAAARRLGAVVALALATLTCGPSFQAVYESDVAFEHCYGLDMSTASLDAKRSCWRVWFASYTYGQSRDRVDYAAARLTELSTDPVTVAGAASASGTPHSAPATGSPLPKDAFVPPPNVSDGRGDVLVSADGGVPNRPSRESAARAPGAECAEACSQHWSACYGLCHDVACGPCDRAYRSCMPLCFREDASVPSTRSRR